ncbi:hypothetical protein [Polyangium jinanense]|uniref:Uncharacterized protein n=1 Tax=Polyangium jinanense TaxID=2829994 RepID=A0A9X3XE97_9BACT|nr:hypothetical protein [Polyangium jinanense]MDC3958959.1 hypothetical protein [Polyangium jinanense]MDC3986416.1 hypothetical protein [Polyangium jinanense]
MIEPIGLGFAGDGRLVHLTALSARDLLWRLRQVNGLRRHELSLFEWRDTMEPELRPGSERPGDLQNPAIATRVRLVRRLRWNRTLAPMERPGDRPDEPRGPRHPALPFISSRELRRVEGVVAARVLDGVWKLSSEEGHMSRGMVPGRGRPDRNRCDYVLLFGAIFVVERLRFASVCDAGVSDVLVERADRSFRLLRFEGVATARDGRGLVLRLRDRMRLDRAWTAPMEDRSEEAVLRWYKVRAVVPQEGFTFVEGPSLLG